MRRTAALIVGGGPAGSAAAIDLARRGHAPLVLERHRVTPDALCGGFLSWRTLASLARLGIEADALNPQRVTQVRLCTARASATAPLPAPALGVSRRHLDTLMLAAAQAAGAGVERGVIVREIAGDTLRLDDGGGVAAGALFLASGKHDIRGLTRPAEARGADPSLGIRLRLPPAPALHRALAGVVELHLVDRGYAGLVVQEDGSTNLCCAVHRSRLHEAGTPAALLAAMAREVPLLGERLAFADVAAPIDAIANVPYGWRERHGVAGLFRLGDQAGVIPSLAGEGMGIALASAADAVAAYHAGGADAGARWQPRFARALARPLAVAGLVRRVAEGRGGALLPMLARAPWLLDAVARATRIAV